MAERICSRCDERVVPNHRGPRVCTHCQGNRSPNPCGGCGGPRRQNERLCSNCRFTQGIKSRPIHGKTCADCGRSFRTRASANYCSSCVHQRSKHPCAECGVPVDKRAEVCRPCWGKRHSSEHSPSWRGGRPVRHRTRGYVRIRVPGHPQAAAGYVREHQFVMEQHLGRYLLPGENVHHRNGVRHDNRIENLELWLVAQPAGQRAVDLLAWAREIIDTYQPIEEQL